MTGRAASSTGATIALFRMKTCLKLTRTNSTSLLLTTTITVNPTNIRQSWYLLEKLIGWRRTVRVWEGHHELSTLTLQACSHKVAIRWSSQRDQCPKWRSTHARKSKTDLASTMQTAFTCFQEAISSTLRAIISTKKDSINWVVITTKNLVSTFQERTKVL